MNWFYQKLMKASARTLADALPSPNAGEEQETPQKSGNSASEAITVYPESWAEPLQGLLAEWTQEVETMRAGDNADWLNWSPACRRRWAAGMLALGAKWEFIDQASNACQWLTGVKMGDIR